MTTESNGGETPAPKKRQTKGIMLAAIAVALGASFLALSSEIGKLGFWSFVKSVQEDRGTYFRLKVKLTYKTEPQDFDIVVGCNVRQINYKDNSRTYEVGLVPTVFGRRMSDGKALVVRPPAACNGETNANGKIPTDLLPLIVVYDDADALDFGIAYLSEDAYESPLSVLAFGGATIEKATRQEFDHFRSAQTNLVTRDSFWSALAGSQVLKNMKLTYVPRHWAGQCQAYRRFRIPERARELVRENWPEAHPRYWTADTWQAESALAEAVMPNRTQPDKDLIQTDREGDAPHSTLAFSWYENSANYGLPTRAGGGMMMGWHRYPASYYPAARTDYLIRAWPADPTDAAAYVAALKSLSDMDIDFHGGQTRGFAYCAVAHGLSWPEDRDLIEIIHDKRSVARIDGQDISSAGHANIVGNPSIARPDWIFENDEYAFRLFYIGLGSTRGDV